jgi:hypothetical protein
MEKPVITFGADPEYFLSYDLGGKPFVMPPAYFRKYLGLEYTPDPKHPLFLSNDIFNVIEDGVAFEIGVKPDQSWKVLLQRIHLAQEAIQEIGNTYGDKQFKFSAIPTINFDCERWSVEDEEFQNTLIFGCDPDMDAFDVEKRCRTVNASQHPFRYGGGHIHMSGHPLFESDPILSIRILAMTAGLAASAYSPVPELEKARTYLYGRPGKFRVQKYPNGAIGVEYRTPSNTWSAKGNEGVAEQVFTWAQFGIDYLMSNTDKAMDLLEGLGKEITNAILSCNQKKCLALLETVKEIV